MSVSVRRTIDVDDRQTWPRELSARVDEWVERCRGTTKYTPDLPLDIEDEAGFRALFRGHLLRVYHCTKLLPHEGASIRREGLRPLSAELLVDRIRSARAALALSADQAERLLGGHVYAAGEQQSREDQVCFVLSKQMFDYHRDGCEPLFATWGGEGIYRSSGTLELRDVLDSIGTPTVVQAAIDLSTAGEHLFFPALQKVFVGVALGLRDAGGDVFYRAAVPGAQIERIIQEGEPEWSALLGT